MRHSSQSWSGRRPRPLPSRHADSGLGRLTLLGAGLVALVLALVLAGLAGVGFLGRSDFFQITAVEIDGLRHATKGEVLGLAGLNVHSNLFTVKPRRLKAAIARHPWIRAVQIRRHWPNRLAIAVTEREPVALVNLAQGLYYLDREVEAFAPASPPADLDLPVVTGLEEASRQDLASLPALADALLVLRQTERDSTGVPKQNLSEIHVEAGGGLRLYLVDRPFPIILAAGRVKEQYDKLARVLYGLYKKNEMPEVAYIRLDQSEERVIVGKTLSGRS
ncbi:MAG: FtsQ-type POTRA domain-containing protein [Thermodesulfobacteriota bacterium]